jgi:hypothetical protein
MSISQIILQEVIRNIAIFERGNNVMAIGNKRKGKGNKRMVSSLQIRNLTVMKNSKL